MKPIALLLSLIITACADGGSSVGDGIIEEPPVTLTSRTVTWTCHLVSSNPAAAQAACPWGGELKNQALVWPLEWGATSARLGYTTDYPVYLPADQAHGLIVAALSGTAQALSGQPGSYERFPAIAALAPGQKPWMVPDLASGGVLSLESSGDAFTAELRR